MHKRGQDETDLEVETEGNSAAIVKHKTKVQLNCATFNSSNSFILYLLLMQESLVDKT